MGDVGASSLKVVGRALCEPGPPEPIIETYVMARAESTDRPRRRALTCRGPAGRLDFVTITLNGEPFELDQPVSVTDLLAKLEIDPRRVAIEHNLTILKRHTFTTVVIGEGDRLEIVNAVGGG